MTSNTRAPQVLDGVRVLDLGSFITAPYAAMLLAEMGADVVKVERPGGATRFAPSMGGSTVLTFKRTTAISAASHSTTQNQKQKMP